jgi:hypothetical protein
VAVRGARLSGFLDGTTSKPSATIRTEPPDKTTKSKDNPISVVWYAHNQQLLSFLLNSVTKEVLGQVATETSTAGMWHTILGMFASQSRVCIVHLRSKLSRTRRGGGGTGFADKMAVPGKLLDDEEVKFNLFVEVFMAKTEPQTLNDLFSQLLTLEPRVEAQNECQCCAPWRSWLLWPYAWSWRQWISWRWW